MQRTILQNKQNTLCFLKMCKTSRLTFLSKLRFLLCQCVGENMRKHYPASIPKRACQMFHHQLKQLLLVFLKRDWPDNWEGRVRGRRNWCPPLQQLRWPCFSLEAATCPCAPVPVAPKRPSSLQEVDNCLQYWWCVMITSVLHATLCNSLFRCIYFIA